MNTIINQMTLQLYYYTNFLLLSIIVPSILLLGVLLLCRKFQMKSKWLFAFAMFFQMNKRDAIYLVNMTIRYLLIISAVIFNMHIDTIFIIILMAMTLIASISYLDIIGFLIELVNNAILTFSLFFVEYMRTLMEQGRPEVWMMVITGLAIAFLVLYDTYFYLLSMLRYLKRRRVASMERMMLNEEKKG